MERKEDIWKNELWSQQEVANHFRVTTNTIKNWRERRLLTYWQAPGSTRKLYFKEEILNFIKANTVMKEGDTSKAKKKLNKEKPVISFKLQDEDWRI